MAGTHARKRKTGFHTKSFPKRSAHAAKKKITHVKRRTVPVKRSAPAAKRRRSTVKIRVPAAIETTPPVIGPAPAAITPVAPFVPKPVSPKSEKHFTKRFLATLIVVAILVAGIGGAIIAQTATVTNTTVGVNTITVAVPSTATITQTNTAVVTATETNTNIIQPVIGLTSTTTTTVVGTVTSAVTQTETNMVTSTTTTTATNTQYYPFVEYYTENTSSGFYRSLSPIVDGPVTETSTTNPDGSQTVTLGITASSTYYDAGFYYDFHTLNSLTSGQGLTITGTGFSVRLWINPQDWTWTGNTYTNLGTDGAYGNGTTTGATTVNGASTFVIMPAPSGSCLNSYSGETISVSTIETACGATTPIAIWVGITSLASTTNTATIDSIYTS
jgi:hypothetical protein